MTTANELIELERAGWDALSTSGEAATKYYDDVLSDEVLVIMPGGMLIDDRQQVVDSMGGAAWSCYQLQDERVLELDPDSAIVSYRGTATRDGQDYEALFNSTYVRRDGDWKLALHQQTPV